MGWKSVGGGGRGWRGQGGYGGCFVWGGRGGGGRGEWMEGV